MIILTLRTDKTDAEIGLYSDMKQLDGEIWAAGRELSRTVHTKIDDMLLRQQKTIHDIQGIVCFKGPGSFTGLRIGISVANAFAYAVSAPIIATEGEAWQDDGIRMLLAGQGERMALPEYGMPPHITVQKR